MFVYGFRYNTQTSVQKMYFDSDFCKIKNVIHFSYYPRYIPNLAMMYIHPKR